MNHFSHFEAKYGEPIKRVFRSVPEAATINEDTTYKIVLISNHMEKFQKVVE